MGWTNTWASCFLICKMVYFIVMRIHKGNLWAGLLSVWLLVSSPICVGADSLFMKLRVLSELWQVTLQFLHQPLCLQTAAPRNDRAFEKSWWADNRMDLVTVFSVKYFHYLQFYWEMLLFKVILELSTRMVLISFPLLFNDPHFSWRKSSPETPSISFCHEVEILMASPVGTWWDWPGCKSVACMGEASVFLNS